MEQMSKFILCVLLTQMGKTFTAIDKIIKESEQDIYWGRSIHIIFTMNTLLNNKQFSKRIEKIEQTYGKNSVCIFSSKYDGKHKHVKTKLELQGLIIDKDTCPRVVLMCSNPKRFSDGLDFIKVIDKNETCIERIFAYFDELHEYINDLLRFQIEQIHDLNIVKGIIALTATPGKILEGSGFWSKIKLIYLDNYSDLNYAGYSDMIFNCIDDYFILPYIRPKPFDFIEMDLQTIGFIENVLKKYPEILSDNTKTFIPAHIRRNSHYEVRDLVLTINDMAIVVVLNGIEKILQYKDIDGNKKTLPLTSTDEEICETISRLIIHHKLQNRPIVITGLLCVGMGQTLTHKSLGSFTSAIFGHMDLTNDEIYQLFGRITGRMKDWDKYIQTQVYCPTIIMHRISVMEECARNMAIGHNGEVISKEDYIEPMSLMGEIGQSAFNNIREKKKQKKMKVDTSANFESGYQIFNTQAENESYAKTVGAKRVSTYEINVDGFKLCSTSNKKVQSLDDILKITKSSNKGCNMDKPLSTLKLNEYAHRRYVCYKDINDKSTECFVTIWVKCIKLHVQLKDA
jgi:hypothetical protein